MSPSSFGKEVTTSVKLENPSLGGSITNSCTSRHRDSSSETLCASNKSHLIVSTAGSTETNSARASSITSTAVIDLNPDSTKQDVKFPEPAKSSSTGICLFRSTSTDTNHCFMRAFWWLLP